MAFRGNSGLARGPPYRLKWRKIRDGGAAASGTSWRVPIPAIRNGAKLGATQMKAVSFLAVALLGLTALPSLADDIGGTGRIEPSGGVVMLAGVQGARILTISVRPGQMVKRGDLLLTLDDREQRANTQIAELALKQAQKDAAQNVAAAQEAVRIDEERLRRAVADAANYRALGPDTTSEKQINDADQTANEDQMQLDIDRKKENQVRADNAANISSANKRLEIERQRLALYRMVAPSDGMILRIDQHVGEDISGSPAVEMGDIRSMYVICQAFQGDLLKLRPGMRATIKNSAFSQPLKGTVENVGRLVDTKAQLGDVRIKLDNPAIASRVVGMEVEVEIAR
jgi:cobalt-zinc-cadmium efflux system membrane fusion protein